MEHEKSCIQTLESTVSLEREDNQEYFAGYAVVFYNPNDEGTEYVYKDRGITVRERILPEAVKGWDKEPIELWYNHSRDHVLDASVDGKSDSRGWKFRSLYDPTDVDHAKTRNKLDKGIAKGCSFKARFTYREQIKGNEAIRTVTNLSDCEHIAIVNKPAYSSTEARIRSVEVEKEMQEYIDKANKLLNVKHK